MFDRLVVSPGNAFSIGPIGGGELLVRPVPPGSMTLTDLLNRTWHLLREPGPDTGDAIVTNGDFSQSVVTRDLNIALAQFISETGVAPAISERMAPFNVSVGMDAPLPPDLVSLARVEYTPAGMYAYTLLPYSFSEWDHTIGSTPITAGQPRVYRAPFAGYIRLYPAPGAGNAKGDLITYYYTSLGTLLAYPLDTPGIPPQFHMALVYRVLMDYWQRKSDNTQSMRYEQMYGKMVIRGKSYTFDADRATQPTIAGDDIDDYSSIF